MKTLKDEFIRLRQEERLYHYEKPIIGLTGGIATGKSSVTKVLLSRGLEVIDADKLVKDIYKEEEAKEFIATNFPTALVGSEIHFPELRRIFFSSPEAKASVEGFIYARLPEAFRRASKKIQKQNFYIYDVPLLFERRLETQMDLKLVVYAPRNLQLERLMKRDGTSEDTANQILDQQLSIEEKKEKADFVIENTGTLEKLTAEVDELLLRILE